MELHVPNFWAFWSIYLHVITLLLFMNLFHPTTPVKALGNETDRFALLKFKEAIATDPHGFLNSWNDSFHFCNWHGITCARRHQRVVALDLLDYHLHGTISPYIGNLSFLRFINLRNNSFSGKIPQLDHLFRLRHLNFSYNMLEGDIPFNLTFCSEMSIINFGNNRLTGKIPSELGSLMKLGQLNLETNNLIGGIPPSLGNLSSITILLLEENNLVGNVPEEIGRLKSLSIFAIGPNQLSGMIPLSIFNISSMNIFSLVSNEFNGSIPPGIGVTMPNLQNCYLGMNKFSGPIPASLSNASLLQLIDISRNNFVGQVPASLGYLRDLQLLNLGRNNLGSNSSNDLGFITSLTNCSRLEVFSVDYNNFGGDLPRSVANLSTQLTHLYLESNQISGTIPASLAKINNLIILNLRDNLFTGVIPTSFGKFQQLQILYLAANRLSGQIPSSIGNLTQLYALDLSLNELEGSIPPSIGNCQNLQQMDISQNRLSGGIPPKVIIGLFSLVLLNLSQNSFIGSLPVEVGKLKNINTLSIFQNNLTGEIPEIIGECLSLEYLNLQGNLLQGIIPSSLVSLKGLQVLNLSGNNLSGQIPKDLERLLFLLYLNISFNNLEGEVPKEGIFRNTSAISLVGNIKLCGGVSELQLPACPIKVSKQRKMHGFKLKLTISLVLGFYLLFVVLFALFWRRKIKKKRLYDVSSINFLSKVSYQTLHQATGGFSSSTLIGSGGFGSVYKAILEQEENRTVAIKVLNLQQKGASKSFMVECNAIRNIRHRNLVKILTCCSSIDYNGNEFKALVFEYMSNGSLEEWLHGEDPSRSLNLLQRLNIAVDVASALCYLHDQCEPQVIHCDLKPSNVLLDDDMVAHVGDFGLARLISTTTNSSQSQSITVGIKGTIGYAAPEYAASVEPSRQGDIYSYGILVLQMFLGRRPTDEMFKDGLNLHNFVKMAVPAKLMQIVDPVLLAIVEETTPIAAENEVNHIHGYNNEIEAEYENADDENLNAYVCKCILPILKIGLACSEDSPKNRMCMEDVTKELHHIQTTFIGVETHQERQRRS